MKKIKVMIKEAAANKTQRTGAATTAQPSDELPTAAPGPEDPGDSDAKTVMMPSTPAAPPRPVAKRPATRAAPTRGMAGTPTPPTGVGANEPASGQFVAGDPGAGDTVAAPQAPEIQKYINGVKTQLNSLQKYLNKFAAGVPRE